MTPQEFYTLSNLKENPFRSNPIAGDPRARIWVGYESERIALERILNRTRFDQVGTTNMCVLLGEYGTGKSHALLWAHHYILHQHADQFQSSCYLIPTLKKDNGKLSFAGAFREDLIAKTTLVADLLSFKQFILTRVNEYRNWKAISSTTPDPEVLKEMIPSSELQSFAIALIKINSQEELKDILMPKGFNDYQAVITFSKIVNLFTLEITVDEHSTIFRKCVYLFFDELDDLLRAPLKEIREINDLIRHLYDMCPVAFCMVLVISAENAELSAVFERFVLDRVHKFIEFRMMATDDALNFVRDILDSARLNGEQQLGFFPYEESAVSTIISSMTQITPRRLVKLMYEITEECRLAGADPSISPISSDFLYQHQILDELI